MKLLTWKFDVSRPNKRPSPQSLQTCRRVSQHLHIIQNHPLTRTLSGKLCWHRERAPMTQIHKNMIVPTSIREKNWPPPPSARVRRRERVVAALHRVKRNYHSPASAGEINSSDSQCPEYRIGSFGGRCFVRGYPSMQTTQWRGGSETVPTGICREVMPGIEKRRGMHWNSVLTCKFVFVGTLYGGTN